MLAESSKEETWQILFLAKVSTDNPSIYPLLSVTAFGGHLVTTILPDTLVVILKNFGKKWIYYNNNCTEHSPSWEANSLSVKKFPTFCGTQKFITEFTSACHQSLP